MAFVISITPIVTQESHGIVWGDMFGMSLDELLGALPQRRNGFNVFVQAEHETVLLLVVLHVAEWVIMNIAEQFDAWFDSPVILELVEERMTEEEA